MAGKFKYRLQQVLNMRVKNEDNLKLALADVKRAAQVEQDALDDLKLREQNTQRQMNQHLEAGRTADVQMANDYAASLKDKITAQEKKLLLAQQKVEQAQVAYKKAQRDSEIIKKHKEKLHERWLAEEKRLEGIRGDEMASNMYQAKQRVRRAQEEEEAEYEERRAALEQADLMLAESAWMQGFLATAQAEAERLNAEWGRN
ncbi:flagellar export protein FliJ [bacterium]|nr:flagellar export protein FliJ [bacterium]